MAGTIFIVDDDSDVRDSLKALLESAGYAVRAFASAQEVLDDRDLSQAGCLIADIRMPDMDGLALQEALAEKQPGIPVVIVTGHGDVPLAVRAMKAGAVDFIEKPFEDELLLAGVKRALALASQAREQASQAQVAEQKVGILTAREREVLQHLAAGRPNKIIAYEMNISPRTVEIHRARLMEKMQARSLSDLVRLAIAARLEPPPRK